MKKLTPISKFQNIEEENKFWQMHKLTDYLNFKNTTRPIYQNNLVHFVTVRFLDDDLRELRKVVAKKNSAVATFVRQLVRAYLEKLRHSV